MKKMALLLILLLALALNFSCAKKPPPGDFIDEEPIIIEEEEEMEAIEEYEEMVEEDTMTVETPPPPPPPPTSGKVFRVQIGAFYGTDGANKRKARSVSLFNKPIYIEYIAPYYKVRVGDFTSKAEAESFKAKVVRYYGDAFVTETTKTP
ncbi:SPOR domain-containing protein [candidate division WOR-3 bacterium]|nr:SPOR domain-containing protein [candidate division WOR-3 bacterium]